MTYWNWNLLFQLTDRHWMPPGMQFWLRVFPGRFNALSGLSCYGNITDSDIRKNVCQCPLGLIPHFYTETLPVSEEATTTVSMPSRADISFLPLYWEQWVQNLVVCQCPLGLISHFYEDFDEENDFKEVITCQCPLGLISHFYGTPSKT